MSPGIDIVVVPKYGETSNSWTQMGSRIRTSFKMYPKIRVHYRPEPLQLPRCSNHTWYEDYQGTSWNIFIKSFLFTWHKNISEISILFRISITVASIWFQVGNNSREFGSYIYIYNLDPTPLLHTELVISEISFL